MKKILIISYFFPPCNLTASQRADSWAKNLHKFGYYPIVITRNWNHDIKNPFDTMKSSGEKVQHTKKESYEVYHLPYRANYRDEIYVKYENSKFVLFRRLLTFFELLSQNFSNYFIPFKNIHRFTEDYLKNNNDIQGLIISGNPFILFKFGYLLKKKFGIKWLADYRDEWNTSQIRPRQNSFEKLVSMFEQLSERKWVHSAETITSVSKQYVQNISKYVNKTGSVILNGFDKIDEAVERLKLFKEFTIVYNGMLYPYQNIEIFLDAFMMLIDNLKVKSSDGAQVNIKLYCPGLAYDKIQASRVDERCTNYLNYIVITERIPKEEVMEIQMKSHLLLMIAHTNSKGTVPSKLYEYISLNKPILLCPCDGNIMEETLKETGMGLYANTTEEAYEILNTAYTRYLSEDVTSMQANKEAIEALTRETQAKKLAEILDTHF